MFKSLCNPIDASASEENLYVPSDLKVMKCIVSAPKHGIK